MLLSLARPIVAAIATLCLGGCTSGSASGLITMDGSSTVFPLSEAVAEEFLRTRPDDRVTVGISGTGGGFQKFCRGEADIANASRPITQVEAQACRAAGITFLELPVAYDGIAIVVHPHATWVDHITVAELRALWAPEAQGLVTRWNQVRPGWPDRELHLFGAGVDSGTFDYFTEAIMGQPKASRGDFTSSEDDNVLVQGIASDELAIGFLPFAYYQGNHDRLKLVPVDDERPANGEGPIAPSMETIRTGIYQPLARPVFIYVTTRAAARPEVEAFVEFYLAHADDLSREVAYVGLGEEAYRLVGHRFTRRLDGSLFGDGAHTVGVTIEALLSREQTP
jgi:phosphate transport system substrate-binding protein